jgi:dextranase
MRKRSVKLICLAFSLLLITGCNKNDEDNPDTIPGNTISVNISTDKAVYKPGDIVSFTADKDLPATALIRYRQLNQTVNEVSYSSRSWTWQTPSTDFTGYLIDLYSIENEKEVVYGTVAVDVSGDWTKFPRYGFLSKFGQLTNSEMDNVIAGLKRYHINGLQFYDWTEKHHKPLAGTVSSPSDDWLDIARRPTYKSTVQYYISRAKEAGIKTMSYNLCYGALNDAALDGVDNSWYLYKDAAHTNKVVFDIGSFLKSPIYLTDPSNTNWQQYLAGRNTDMYSVFNFDGFHIDQLGNQGTVYNYNGESVNLAASFGPFIESMKTLNPDKRLVFNSVNQFGQEGSIATSSVDFLYTEVWGPNDKYSDLAGIIKNNDTYSSNTKRSVLAAYMNYNKAENPGSFNTPSVLFTDAVIFAFGGAHLELGEHMLGK